MRHATIPLLVACAAILAGCAGAQRPATPSHEASRDSHQRAAADQDRAFKALDAGAAK